MATQEVSFTKNSTQTYEVDGYQVQIVYNGNGVKSVELIGGTGSNTGSSTNSGISYDANHKYPVTGTFQYQFDQLYRVIHALEPNSGGNTGGNNGNNDTLVYQYNNLNQLTKKIEKNWSTSYTYDLKGNLIREVGPSSINVDSTYVYDGTNRLAEGKIWNGDKSQYTYNGLGWRVNQKEIYHSGQTLERQFVLDYTSETRRDLAIYKIGETVQRHVFANGERIEQITEHYPGNNGNGNMTRKLYVHNGVMGTSVRYSKDNGQQFANIDYDLFGSAISPSKLINNDNGVDVLADYTGYTYDYVLDKYFAQYRFYDAGNRRFMAKDPIKDGLNWYAYVGNNPVTFVDPLGLRNYIVNGIANEEPEAAPSYMFDFKNALEERGVTDIVLIPAFNETGKISGGTQVILDWKGQVIPVYQHQYSTPNTEIIAVDENDVNEIIYAPSAVVSSELIGYVANLEVLNSVKAAQLIAKDLALHPLENGETINFIGYSGGGTVFINAVPLLEEMMIAEGIDKEAAERNLAAIDKAVFIGVPGLGFDLSYYNEYLIINGLQDPLPLVGSDMETRTRKDTRRRKIMVGAGHTDYFNRFYLPSISKMVAEFFGNPQPRDVAAGLPIEGNNE